MHIGKAIKDIRIKKKIKQGDLANACNISQSYLSLVEKGDKTPSSQLLEKISKVLDYPAAMLSFLALDEKDIKPEKREAFKILMPAVKSMVDGFFIDD